MRIHRLPKSTPRFTSSAHDSTVGKNIYRTQLQAERSIAASTLRDAVRTEAQLLLDGDNPEELARIRSKISAYCNDYKGMNNLVTSLRDRLGITDQIPSINPA
jgi:hypothetical protein